MGILVTAELSYVQFRCGGLFHLRAQRQRLTCPCWDRTRVGTTAVTGPEPCCRAANRMTTGTRYVDTDVADTRWVRQGAPHKTVV